MLKTSKKSINKRRSIILISVAAVLVVLAAGWLIYENNKPSNESLYGSESTKPTNNTPAASNTGGGTSTTKDPNNNPVVNPAIDSSITPKEPSGVFVSHHKPNLSGSPISNMLSSTCTTTPGAYCTVRFINGSVIKTLPEKQTDGDGNAYWNWSLQEMGLTVGKWNVTGVARNGSHESSSKDAIPLSVEP